MVLFTGICYFSVLLLISVVCVCSVGKCQILATVPAELSFGHFGKSDRIDLHKLFSLGWEIFVHELFMAKGN